MYKEAQRALVLRRAEVEAIKAGATLAVDRTKTWEDFVELWADVNHAKKTLKDNQIRIKRHLKPTLGGRLLVDIDPRLIARLDRDLHQRMKVGTVRQVLGLLRSMLNVAVEHQWLLASPKVKLLKPEDRDYTWIRSEEEMRRFLAAAQESPVCGLMEMYATTLYTGMLAGELGGLERADVDLDRRLITVERSWDQTTTKTKFLRRVLLLDPLLPLLVAWKDLELHQEVVFPNLGGKRHVKGARVFTKTYKGCLLAAVLSEGLRFRDLRHA